MTFGQRARIPLSFERPHVCFLQLQRWSSLAIGRADNDHFWKGGIAPYTLQW